MTGLNRIAIIGGSEITTSASWPIRAPHVYDDIDDQLETAFDQCDKIHILVPPTGLKSADSFLTESDVQLISELSESEIQSWARRVAGRLLWLDAAAELVVLAEQSLVEPLTGYLNACPQRVDWGVEHGFQTATQLVVADGGKDADEQLDLKRFVK